jgi:hypothetical protein
MRGRKWFQLTPNSQHKDIVLQQISTHALAQATVKARASGELVFARAPEKYTEGKDSKELALVSLTDTSNPAKWSMARATPSDA